ncbi:SDR family NAD(P)-dependent oxidoreductase [Roseospira goensis]|uniref:NAD(P)-dependent dehydrogenase (Short-subunit alcohol dehydrogenase family) n=1 Tax=Roseospira goensis TaxID=391922 RepID=A0A7W6RZ65_9PROT|nr:SDR family NAD(P)-dependent oxidoreductase [Roseospira goensis]MBB4285908.1 NAD(P)-dependent dehydrogenase (short-subunit alcohol dehydrogenase family) [Roseospira goensis]
MRTVSSPYADLDGQRAFITGGATGIGRAIATALAARGVRVAVGDLNADGAAAVAQDLGATATSVALDVRSRTSVDAAFRHVLETLGGCDILIANAGVSSMKSALDLTDEDWDFNMEVNTRGVFLSNQIAARHFLATGTGCIVNTASLASKVGAPFLAHYSASKFAVLGWTQALARELGPKGIRVNAVCPGYVKTGMQGREVQWEAELRGITPEQVLDDYVSQTPLGRLETPEDVADVVVFLCSDQARFMTGQGINVTGGVYMT